MFREQGLEQLVLVRLEQISAHGPGRLLRGFFLQGFDRQQFLDHHALLHHGFEFVVDHVQLIERAVVVLLDDILPHVQGMFETQTIEDARPFLPDRPRAPPEKITAFSPGYGHTHLLTTLRMLLQKLRGLPENIGVKRPAQSPVTRDHEQFGFLALAFVQQGMGEPARPFRKMPHHVP